MTRKQERPPEEPLSPDDQHVGRREDDQSHGSKPVVLDPAITKYASDLAESETISDQHSLDAARAIARTFEDGEWVDEWLARQPIKRASDSRGRPVDPKSQTRFGQWLRWKLDQEGHHALSTSQANRLMLAARTAGILTPAGRHNSVSSERVLRPLNWLTTNKYQDHIPEVWARAVDLAGGLPEDVTSAHTAKAVAEFKKGLGRKAVKQAARTKAADRHLGAAKAEIGSLWRTGNEDAQRKFDEWYKKVRRGEIKF